MDKQTGMLLLTLTLVSSPFYTAPFTQGRNVALLFCLAILYKMSEYRMGIIIVPPESEPWVVTDPELVPV